MTPQRVLDPIQKVREVVPEAVRWRQRLSSDDLVVDIRYHIEHLAAHRHGGVWARTKSNLSSEDPDVCS